MNVCVVIASVRGRPSDARWSAVRAMLSCASWRMAGPVTGFVSLSAG